MSIEQWMPLVAQLGCAALFFSLCLGLIGLPIPNEAVAATAGALAGAGMLPAVPAFFATYLGTVSGLTFGYAMGRKFGPRLFARLGRRGSTVARGLERSEQLMREHGNAALLFSYFIPLVRHLVPILAGAQRFAYRRFALSAYAASLIWTTVYFTLGSTISVHAESVGGAIRDFGTQAFWLIAVTAVCWFILRNRRQKSRGRGM
ncbi:MAG: DedA family protein [Paenibacillaceae bacterium]|nr:DedA family protein [Paenibacillaceae bacterium]